jgi:trimeric autotransporter adhesin
MRYASAIHLGKGLSLVASVLVLGLAFGGSEAQAQFKCVDAGLSDGGATATGVQSVACGTSAVAIGGGTAIGNAATALSGTTAVGNNAGSFSNPSSSNNTALGSSAGSNVNGSLNTATGTAAGQGVFGNENVAVGHFSGGNVTGDRNISMGLEAGALTVGNGNIAVGANTANTVDPITGKFPSLFINNTVALGDSAKVGQNNATALGANSNAGFANSTAIGQGATTTRANQQMFGTTANSYTMAGINTTSTSAQVGPVNLVTADTTGTLGVTSLSSLGIASTAAVSNLQNQINDLYNRDQRLSQGIAMAAAIPQSIVLPGENFSLNMDWANYTGNNALGLSSAVRIGSFNFGGTKVGIQGNVGVAVGVDGGNQAVTRAGVRLGW